jgi:hypothetical protein
VASSIALTAFLRDLVHSLREAAADAHDAPRTNDEQRLYESGRESAFVEVLMVMQGQAAALELDLSELGLADFDPLSGDLRPPVGVEVGSA